MCLLNNEAPVFLFFYYGIHSVIKVNAGDVCYLIKIQEKFKGLSLRPSVCWPCFTSMSTDCGADVVFCFP